MAFRRDWNGTEAVPYRMLFARHHTNSVYRVRLTSSSRRSLDPSRTDVTRKNIQDPPKQESAMKSSPVAETLSMPYFS